jgi:hypothetical protein
MAADEDPQARGSVGRVVNEEKVDIRPAEECAGVARAGEDCEQGGFERARPRSLVRLKTCM